MAFDRGGLGRGYLGELMRQGRETPLRWGCTFGNLGGPTEWKRARVVFMGNGRLAHGLFMPSLSVFTPDPGLCARARLFSSGVSLVRS